MLFALLVNFWRGVRLPEWYMVASQGLLAQSWLPWTSEDTVQSHCWFLSALVPYWLLFDLLFRKGVLRLTRLPTVCTCCALLLLLPWLSFFLPAFLPGFASDWYSEHRHGRLVSWYALICAEH